METPALFCCISPTTMDEKPTPKPEVKAKAVEAEVAPETKPEPIVIKTETVKAPEPVPAPAMPIEPPSAPEPPKAEVPVPEKAPEPPKAPEPAKLFSVKTDAYSAWVTQNGDKSFLANLELTGGSAYNWTAGSASEAEELLKYHIANQKL